jgi:hypothetical protein
MILHPQRLDAQSVTDVPKRSVLHFDAFDSIDPDKTLIDRKAEAQSERNACRTSFGGPRLTFNA